MWPSIDILVPFKHAAPWFEDCLRSIQRQSFQDWTCYLIDDHSTDRSREIAREFERADARYVVLTNSGKGIVDALLTGLQAGRSEWITRMDADDIMPPMKLQQFIEVHDGSAMTVATGKVRYFSTKRVSDGYRDYERWLNERVDQDDHWSWVYRECVIASANWLAHRSQVSIAQGRYPEDYGLVLDWYVRGVRIRATRAVTHLWREHPHRTSRTSSHYAQAAFFRLKVRHFLRHRYDTDRPLVILGDQQKAKHTRSILDEEGIAYDAFTKSDISALKSFDTPQVLVCVFPPPRQRMDLEEFLKSLKLLPGQDWWWL